MTNSTYSVRRNMRTMIVIVLYEYELLNKKISEREIFESDVFHDLFNYNELKTGSKDSIFKEQMKIISVIEKNYDLFKKMIVKYVRNDWSWERLDPFVRSLLLCASVELWRTDKAIIANEYVSITKDFIPDDRTYKFVNKIIDNIGKEYYEFKSKKD